MPKLTGQLDQGLDTRLTSLLRQSFDVMDILIRSDNIKVQMDAVKLIWAYRIEKPNSKDEPIAIEAKVNSNEHLQILMDRAAEAVRLHKKN